MATTPESTTLGCDEITAGVNNASDVSIHIQNHVASGAGQENSKIIPLEIEGENLDETEYPTGIKFTIIIAATGLCLVLVGLDCNIISTAVPAITTHFNTSSDIGWYYTAYRLTGCAFQFMFGKLYNILPIKTIFLVSVIIFEIGSLIAATATVSDALILGRAISGFGSGGIVAGCFTILAQCVPLRQRPLIGGVGAGMEGISAVAGPVLGGILTDRLSWRWCFYINLPCGFITVILLAIFFENPRQASSPSLSWKHIIVKLDLLGTALFVPAITVLMLALQWGGSKYGWEDARIIVLICVSATLLAGFAFQQWKTGDNATLPARVFADRSLLAGFWFSFCNGSALAVIEYYMPIYFQVVKDVSATHSGILCIPPVIGLFVSVILGGSGTSFFGYYAPFMIATSVLTPIAAGLLTTVTVNTPFVILIVYQAFLGFAAGIGFQGPQTAASTVFAPADQPLGIAAILFAQNFGPAFFVPVAQTIFEGRLVAYLEQYFPQVGGTALSNMGLLDLKARVGSKDLGAALVGYDEAVTKTFYLPLALSCVSIIGALGMEWKTVKTKKS